MGQERVVAEPASRARGRRPGRPKTRSTSVPSCSARMPAPAMPPVARTNASAARRRVRDAASVWIAVTRRPARSTSTTSKPIWIRPPGRQDPAPKRLEQAQAGHRWREARDLEDAVPERRLGLGMDLGVPIEAEDRGHADAPVAPPGGRRRGLPGRARRQVASSNRRATACGPRLWSRSIAGRSTSTARTSAGPSGHAAFARLRAAYGGPRIGVAAEADHDEPGSGPRLERGCLGERQDGGAAQRADGGRDRHQRVVERAGVRQALGFGSRQVGGDGRIRVRGERAIGVAIGPRPDGGCRRAAVVAPSGAATSRPPCVQCVVATPLAATNTLAPRLRQLGGARQAGQPGPDDDDVSARHDRASGWAGAASARASTASVPRKMPAVSHSSASWSPHAIGRVPRNRSAMNPRSGGLAAPGRRASRAAAARGMQNAPWQGPMPSRVVRRRSSRDESPRSSSACSRRARVTTSHSHTSSAFPPPVASWAASRSPSQYGVPVAGAGSGSSAVRHGASTPRLVAHRVDDVARHEPIRRQLPADDAPQPATPSRRPWSITWWARLISRDSSWRASPSSAAASYRGREPA